MPAQPVDATPFNQLIRRYFSGQLIYKAAYRHADVDRIVEGDEAVLIDGCEVQEDRLEKELLTLHELEAAAHRQGFSSLEEVDRAVLEPGGTISFCGKKPEPDESRHRELLGRLDQVMREIEKLHGPPRASA